MVRFFSLTSGSCGNCYYLGTEEGGLLIDAGASLRKLKKGLEENHLSYDSFSAVLVTHEHLDHIHHLGNYCKKIFKPVYSAPGICQALREHTFTRGIVDSFLHEMPSGSSTEIGPFSVRWFEVPHDARQTVGYAIEVDGLKFVIMTDIGRMTEEAIAYAKEADTLVIESNYDLQMLLKGPYSYELKMRIIKGHGHMSNDECADALRQVWHPGLKHVFLCHLSQNNNTPQRAIDCARAALQDAGADLSFTSLRYLPRYVSSPLFFLK